MAHVRSRVRVSAPKNEHVFSYGFSGDSGCYRLLHTRRLWDMLNEVFHQHQQISPSCGGRLDFDYASEQQRMLCWREKVICDRCQYESQMYNLYEEIKTGKPGRKPATANVGLNTGFSNTPIGPRNVRKIFLSTNILAPSRNSIGHRELIISPIDPNGEPLVFDSLFCISQYMWGITICLKFKPNHE